MISSIIDAARMKPEGRRLRKKTQKIDSLSCSRQTSNTNTNENESADKRKSFFRSRNLISGTTASQTGTPQQQSCLTLPDIVDDGRRYEQLRKGGNFPQGGALRPQSMIHHSKRNSEPIPEFSHLTINNRNPDKPIPNRSSTRTSPPRRHAKTPVLMIGQLENSEAQKASSAEVIAESYRALLEPHYYALEDTPELPRMEEQSETSNALPSHDRSPKGASKPAVGRPRHHSETWDSPVSDDGTLVGFEETPAYFKPASSTLGSSSSMDGRGRDVPQSPVVSPGVKNPSLEISLDLLTRELAAAASGTRLRPSADTSALQIWVMIEAYEKLRDRLLETRTRYDQATLAMFGMWLQALHRIHDQMTGSDGQISESDYGE
ncbi:hypothetical protein DL764_000905 [Monosporascus ibericus]|uniref:Mating-type switching protein swi10 n=1 Tax=Monosporascus ibericus TaxID=155417 RepID=A0A4Q4TV29_9PEZI|nr:hypothetical protein DL764_000905 [Monosporascus ibericus]